MRVVDEPNDYRAYYELTPEQWQAGMDYLEQGGQSYEYSSEDNTFLKIVGATPQQVQDFEAVLA